MKWPYGWRETPFLTVCELNPRLAPTERPPGQTPVSFVPMSAADESIGAITAPETRSFAEVQKGYTPFRDGDVLFAKVTPCMENGKAAVARDLVNGLGFGSTEFHVLRPKRNVLLAEFLFHFVRQPWFRAHAAAAFVGTGGLQRVPPAFFNRIKLPLPPLIEQQRIVEMLREASALPSQSATRYERLSKVIDRSLQSAVASCDESDWRRLGLLVETRYGTSVRAEADLSSGVPVLRIPNVLGGQIDTTDLKFASLPGAERERLGLQQGDVLIVRSNGNPDYVGRCAPVDERVAGMGCVYASYLIRLRPNGDLRGTYLAALLNSSIGRKAMRNAIRTTAGQSNLSSESLEAVRLPVPPIDAQLRFEDVWHEVQALRHKFQASEQKQFEITQTMVSGAVSGRLTAAWREQHRTELEAAIREHDAALSVPTPHGAAQIAVHAPPERDTRLARPRRQALIDQLSSFQHEVWNTLRHEWRGAVLADDPAVFDDFCTSPQTAWRLEGFAAGRDEVRRALEQLAAMGLVRKMSLPRANPTSGRTEYLTAFRPLREAETGGRVEEDAALQDVERVAKELLRGEQQGR